MRFLFTIAFICLVNTHIDAQVDLRSGVLPAIKLNNKFSNDWRINLATESRLLQQDHPNGELVGFELIDLSLYASKKINIDHTVALGYLNRINQNGEVFHRFTQQYTYVNSLGNGRTAHRFRLDETFGNVLPVFRLRYRFSFEMPLNGQEVDPGEWYLVWEGETVGSLENKTGDLELRFVPAFGTLLTNKSKLEISSDLRLSGILLSEQRISTWLRMSLYHTINWIK